MASFRFLEPVDDFGFGRYESQGNNLHVIDSLYRDNPVVSMNIFFGQLASSDETVQILIQMATL
jgi:hypothetical protein